MRKLNHRALKRATAYWTTVPLLLELLAPPMAHAVTTPSATAPQVLIVVTNSESMDGNTSGAIMTGSGSLATAEQSLYTSSSPVSYTIPSGFTPPINAGSSGMAPYTVACPTNSSLLCDNSPSRLNMAKAAINTVVNTYASQMFFGLYDYSTSSVSKYNTWVYYMSPSSSGFTFTNTFTPPTSSGVTQSVINPCYNYTTATANVKTNCTTLDNHYSASIASYKYMNVSASSDDANVNDVLYDNSGTLPDLILEYGTRSPSTPYPPNYSLSQFNLNNGTVKISYSSSLPISGGFTTSPTNAGFVGYSPEIVNFMRGFAYGANQSATTGNVVVPMATTSTVSSTLTAFQAALLPETSSASTTEIKASAGQAATGGLLSGALSYLNGLSKATCQKQYVILLTDGLPTLDKSGHAWPPLGSYPGNQYGVTATFNADGSLNTTNDQALTDAINAIKALNTAGVQTYVVGLGAGVTNSGINPMAAQTLTAMAVAGGTGSFYAATDPTSLQNALNTIVAAINAQTVVTAPIVKKNAKDAYVLENSGAAIAGSVLHFSSPTATTSSWDAATLMNASNRAALLKTTASDNKTISLFSSIDAAAFNLTPTTCVPDTNTIVQYTINPSYTYTPASGSACVYLAGRQSNWFLGSFSNQNAFLLLGPPAATNSKLLNDSSYVTWARSEKSRSTMLLFTNNDGFLYSVDATSGNLLWGWTPRSLLAKFQNYASTPVAQLFNGGFTVADVYSGSGWASYVVGSLQSGAEHYSVQLDANGNPTSVAYDNLVSGGTSPGDASASVGTAPRHQIPQVVYVGSPGSISTYAVYVVNTSTSSTLYEVNIGTGTTTSQALSFTPSSAIYVNPKSNQLYIGSTVDDVWRTTVTGNAANDVATMLKVASTVNPADNSTKSPITYVADTMVNGSPYIIATNQSQITVFGVANSGGWIPYWASTPSGGYSYSASSGKFSASSAVQKLFTNVMVTDAPTIGGSVVTLPVSSPPPTCGDYSAYLNLFDIPSGSFPTVPITYLGATLTSNLYLGSGISLTPGLQISGQGIDMTPGTTEATKPLGVLHISLPMGKSVIGWQQK